MAGTHPPTRRDDVVDILHGVPVADPYRWLEDPDDPEVASWVEAQRVHAEDALAALPERAWFGPVMERLLARPRAGVPLVRGGRHVVSRNDGGRPHDVWWSADSWDELRDGGSILLDPNEWSDDGSVSLSAFSIARDGSLMAYARSEAGSDWQHVRVRDLATGEDRPGEVIAKFSVPTWLPDHRSFLYTAYAEADEVSGSSTAGLGVASLMVHRLDGDDEEVVSFPGEPATMAFGEVSHDGRWLIVSIVRGTENVNRLWLYPLQTDAGRTSWGAPLVIVDQADAEYRFVRVDGPWLYLFTDKDAPRGRVVRVDLTWAQRGDVEFTEVIPESRATLQAAEPAGPGLLLAFLDDAMSVVEYCSLDGATSAFLPLPAGALVALDSEVDRPEAFLGISTVASPTSAYRVHVPGVAVEPIDLCPPSISAAVEPAYTLSRRRATSADGTPVPYFWIVPQDGRQGPRPTLLYGYGGFKIPVLADYRPGWPAWLAAGGALAIANLRGGGEFGTTWYDAGRLENKQRVFDDIIAVAEHLIDTDAAGPGQVALHGRSNGGLLVGAAVTQRPDLFAAALPGVGVLDLVRFHRFTIGAAWMSDYGDPDTPEGFAAAYAYSPLHAVREGVDYPPTLVMTADHDDRVVPLHSFKFAAALQHAQGGDAPILLRIESSAGHGAGKPSAMIAAEWADLLAFAAHCTGLDLPPTP